MSALPSRVGLACLLFFALALSGPVDADAQSAEAGPRVRRTLGGLPDSARVRLLAPGLIVDDGRFRGFRQDSVWVDYADARFAVGLDELEGLEVRGSRWQSLALQSGAVGLVAGAATGLFLAYFRCGDLVQECDAHAGGVALRWGLVFGAGGGLVGALVGSRMTRWRRVFP